MRCFPRSDFLCRQQLQEQAKLVVEENALLMEQQEIKDRKMKEMQRVHGQEGWYDRRHTYRDTETVTLSILSL